jgi:hypothetical protein
MKRYQLFILFLIVACSSHAQEWKLKDIGVGLVVQDANYDKVLNIAQRGTSWDMDELYVNGAFSGRTDGTKALAAWIQGPHTDKYKNSYGTPVWYYKYKITYPDGSIYEAGPYGFYTPGFAVVGLTYGKKGTGKYKIDFYISNRDTQETRFVGSTEFTAIYKQ